MNNNHASQIDKFRLLQKTKKSAALDINSETGELVVRCTKSTAGEEGNGTPPIPFTDKWERIMVCNKGVVTQA